MTRSIADVPEHADPSIEFAVARRMPYDRRIAWSVGLAAAGVLLQIVTLNVLAGVLPIAAAVALSWNVGYDARLDRRGLDAETGWQTVPWAQATEILRLDDRQRRWDDTAAEVSSPVGCVVAILVVAVLAAATVAVATAAGSAAAAIVATDGALLVLAQWFSGMRSVSRRPALVRAATVLTQTAEGVERRISELGATLRAQVRMAKSASGVAPEDLRLLIRFPAPAGRMLLVQGQVVTNHVRGAPYPYFYAVVIATAGGPLSRSGVVATPDGVVCEPKTDGGVDLVVVRQATTSTSGYHTGPVACRVILGHALDLASLAAGPRPA